MYQHPTMGYSEVYCHICGVSFNIGRIRKPDEPPSSAWDNTGYSTGLFVRSPTPEASRSCPQEAGCLVVRRDMDEIYARHTGRYENPVDPQELSGDDPEDGDFVYESAEDDEPYEYDTPDESESESNTMDESDEQELDTDAASEFQELYDGFRSALTTRNTRGGSTVVGDMVPQHEQPEATLVRFGNQDRNLYPLEHIAGGLGCQLNSICPDRGGYNGHAISAEAMRGCNTLQCLVRKPDGWDSESDDEDFEGDGSFFLSGLSDYMPSRDEDSPQVFPERHDCERPYAENVLYEPEKANEYAMPFHPTCLEAFKRASLQRTGSIDIEGLTDWWSLDASYEVFHSFPRDPAVNCSQWHEHVSGAEFVAANPCFVPGLPAILASADRKADANFVYGSVFDTSNASTGAGDVFSRLSQELRDILLVLLDPADIANLRLASRTFRQLPQSFFRSLILREMPWLWEAWSSLDYSFWSTTTSLELKTDGERSFSRLTGLKSAIGILYEEGRQEGLPVENDAAIAALKQAVVDEENRGLRPTASVPLLVADKTDWYRLCCDLAKNHKRLLGLRNRRRIWKDCEEILDRIERYRDEGKIVPGQCVDAQAAAQEAQDRVVEANRRWQNYCRAGRPGGVYNEDDWATVS